MLHLAGHCPPPHPTPALVQEAELEEFREIERLILTTSSAPPAPPGASTSGRPPPAPASPHHPPGAASPPPASRANGEPDHPAAHGWTHRAPAHGQGASPEQPRPSAANGGGLLQPGGVGGLDFDDDSDWGPLADEASFQGFHVASHEGDHQQARASLLQLQQQPHHHQQQQQQQQRAGTAPADDRQVRCPRTPQALPPPPPHTHRTAPGLPA